MATGSFGSVDANRGDPQNGWDTDQFPNSVDELSLVLLEILRGGGFENGGFNFDTKLRRQSLDRSDLFHGHVGGIDTLARALLVAEALHRPTARSTATAPSATPAGTRTAAGRSSTARSTSPPWPTPPWPTSSTHGRCRASRSGWRTTSTG